MCVCDHQVPAAAGAAVPVIAFNVCVPAAAATAAAATAAAPVATTDTVCPCEGVCRRVCLCDQKYML